MKNASKSRFLACFRPVVDIDAMLESTASVNRSSSRRFSCTPVADKHETKLLDQENWVAPQPPKRKLAKVIKAVVFETILNKRAQYKKRYSQDCFGSKRSYSEYSESSSTGVNKSMLRLESVDRTNELSLRSSSSSSPAPKSKGLSKYDSNKEQLEKCCGIFLVLISLAATAYWGRLRGIILTSIWLCFYSLLVASFRRLKRLPSCGTQNPKTTRIGNRTIMERAGPKGLYIMGH